MGLHDNHDICDVSPVLFFLAAVRLGLPEGAGPIVCGSDLEEPQMLHVW